MSVTYPGETRNYRAARNTLLQEETALRAQIERIAALRRALPEGGPLKEDYKFSTLNGEQSKLSELFLSGSGTLAIYSLMFTPDAQTACPMCCSLLDGLSGQAAHIAQNLDLVVVAAASPEKLSALAKARGWSGLILLSTQDTSYQVDYHAQTSAGDQLPMMNIFRKNKSKITHFWGSEGFFADVDGQPRHLDQIWPLWNMLDLTPQGRGTTWHPGLSYPG